MNAIASMKMVNKHRMKYPKMKKLRLSAITIMNLVRLICDLISCRLHNNKYDRLISEKYNTKSLKFKRKNVS